MNASASNDVKKEEVNALLADWATGFAGTGPEPMMVGSTPAQAMDTMVAKGLSLYSLAFSFDISIMAVAPAFNGDELPAVICPSGLNAGFSAARPSSVVSGLMLRSVSNTTFLPSA